MSELSLPQQAETKKLAPSSALTVVDKPPEAHSPKSDPQETAPKNNSRRSSENTSQTDSSEKPQTEPNLTSTNPYEMFGLPKNATPQEIQSRYRELAKKYHPDRNKDGAEQFLLIQSAYDILSKPESRAALDASMEKAVQAARNSTDILHSSFPNQQDQLIRTGFENVSGKPYSELSPSEIQLYLPAAIMETAREMHLAVFPQPKSEIIPAILITGPEATVIKALMNAGSDKEAQAMMFMFILMALMSMIGSLANAAGGDYEKAQEGIAQSIENAQVVGGMLKGIYGELSLPSLKSLIEERFGDLNKSKPASEKTPSRPKSAKASTPSEIPDSIRPRSHTQKEIAEHQAEAALAETSSDSQQATPQETALPKPVAELPAVTETSLAEQKQEQELQVARTALVAAAATPKPVPVFQTNGPGKVPTNS